MKKEKCKKQLKLVSNWRKQFFTYSFWLNVVSGGAASDDRVLLTRAQPMSIFWRVEIRSGGAALTGGKLFLNWGPIV